IPVAFNCFMNVPVDGTTGALTVEPPLSKAGDHIAFVAEADLIVGLTACSADTFRIIYGDTNPHRGCFGNLAAALDSYGIAPDRIPVAFNCFMNVPVDGTTGALTVEPPLSKAGDHIVFVAEADLIVGLTACSALQSNNGSFKPIHYRIDPAG
ncbi:MAG: DUF1989 domain-containing protein, partial [Methylobacterium sp.]